VSDYGFYSALMDYEDALPEEREKEFCVVQAKFIYAVCDECGLEIYESEFVYTLGGHVYCEDCVEDSRREASAWK
jgi:formylmethanofuran dehydrogenase subunit E